jgi:hypothetical protein
VPRTVRYRRAPLRPLRVSPGDAGGAGAVNQVADLRVNSITPKVGGVTKLTPAEGDLVTWDVEIENIGTAATVAGILDVVVYIGDIANWSDNVSTVLAAGATRTQSTNGGSEGNAYWVAEGGVWDVNVLVNGGNPPSRLPLTESNYANNTLATTITVTGTAPNITAENPPDDVEDEPYAGYTFLATGDTPITWAVHTGSLPAGLSLSSGGVLSGTPTTIGTSVFTVRATNATGTDTSSSISITITAVPEPGEGQNVYTWFDTVTCIALNGAGQSGLNLQDFEDAGVRGHVLSDGTPSFPFPSWKRTFITSLKDYGDVWLGMHIADLDTERGVPQNQSEWDSKIAVLEGLIGEAQLLGVKGFAFDPEPYNGDIEHHLCWDRNGTPGRPEAGPMDEDLCYDNGFTMGAMVAASGLNTDEGAQFYLTSDSAWPGSSLSVTKAAVQALNDAGQPWDVDSGFRFFMQGFIDGGANVNMLDASFQGSVQYPGCGGDPNCAIPHFIDSMEDEFGSGSNVRGSIMVWPDFDEGGPSNAHQLSQAQVTSLVSSSMVYATGAFSLYTHRETMYLGNDDPSNPLKPWVWPPPGEAGPAYWQGKVLPGITAGLP